MAISSPGIGSNLDVESIVNKLMVTEQGPLKLIKNQKSDFQTKISAYGSLKSVLSTFQTTLGNLSNLAQFNTQKAESANTGVFTATSNGNAVESNYAIKVNQLAQPQKIALAGVTSPNTVIGTGRLTLSFGTYDSTANSFTLNTSRAVTNIDITPANNTLAGVRDAINIANAGVSATIVNDGQASRLVITSKNSGTANSIKLSVADDDGASVDSSGLSQLAFDPVATSGNGKNLSVLLAAKDAIVDIDGVIVTKPSNVIYDAVEGITLNLLKVDPSSTNLGVLRDQSAIESSVTSFVKAFNDANQTLRNLTKYDPTSRTGGTLVGDATTRAIATQIKQVLTNPLSSSGSLTSLSQIGVTFQRDGTLTFDSGKLKTAIQNNSADIGGLFAAIGKASDAQVSQVGQTDKTQPGSYAINLTRLATQGNVLANSAPGLSIIQGVNDHIALTIDSVAYSFDLTAGNYSSTADLANELQTRVAAAGTTARVAVIGGNIQVISTNYGMGSSVMLTASNGTANLFGGSPIVTGGLDAAGSINGAAAVGVGQRLIGASGDVSAGLAVQVSGGNLGGRGTVNYSQGYAYQLNKLMQGLLASDGILTSRTDGIAGSITRLTKQQESLQDRLKQIEKRYREQFTSLDTLIGSMQQTSSYLTQQIAQFQNNK